MPRAVRNRLHLDVNAGSRPGDAAIKPACACRCGGRTVGRLGATFVIAGTERDEYCVTVLDSEANEFDVQ